MTLEERLALIADSLEGADWPDVRRRARQPEPRPRALPRRRLLLFTAALVLAALVSASALGLGDRLLDFLSLSESEEIVPRPGGDVLPVPYVYGDRLFGLEGEPRHLAEPLAAPLLGRRERLALLSPDGRRLAYHAWERGAPVLRVYDLHADADRVLARGAQSAAWRNDGALAFWQPERRRYDQRRPYLGHVVVRDTAGRAEVWTPEPGPYTVSGWAGGTLLITVRSCLICPTQLLDPGVYALDAPGRARALGLSHVVAVSPDGRLVLGGYVPVPGQDSPSSVVRVVEVTSGRVLAELDLRRSADASVPADWLAAGLAEGSWQDDRIAAVASHGNASSLVLLRFAHDRLGVERVLRIDDEARMPPGSGPFFGSPRFLGAAGRQLGVRVDVASRDEKTWFTAFLTCDLAPARCEQGKPTSARRWLVLVD